MSVFVLGAGDFNEIEINGSKERLIWQFCGTINAIDDHLGNALFHLGEFQERIIGLKNI